MKRVRTSRKYRVWKKIGEGMNIIEIHCMHNMKFSKNKKH